MPQKNWCNFKHPKKFWWCDLVVNWIMKRSTWIYVPGTVWDWLWRRNWKFADIVRKSCICYSLMLFFLRMLIHFWNTISFNRYTFSTQSTIYICSGLFCIKDQTCDYWHSLLREQFIKGCYRKHFLFCNNFWKISICKN